jgi:hypothetical protein
MQGALPELSKDISMLSLTTGSLESIEASAGSNWRRSALWDS